MDNGQFKRTSLCKVLKLSFTIEFYLYYLCNYFQKLLTSLLSAFDGTTSFVSYMVYLNQFDMVFVEKTKNQADGGGDKHFFEGRWIP